jgi:hypothetical protein
MRRWLAKVRACAQTERWKGVARVDHRSTHLLAQHTFACAITARTPLALTHTHPLTPAEPTNAPVTIGAGDSRIQPKL